MCRVERGSHRGEGGCYARSDGINTGRWYNKEPVCKKIEAQALYWVRMIGTEPERKDARKTADTCPCKVVCD